MPDIEIVIPYHWKPREYQLPAWEALESGIKRACLIWHRRAGKDLFCVNWIAAQAMRRIGAYWHIFPSYKQGRKVAWEGKTKTGRAFIDHFPKEIISRYRDQEMTIEFVNGSTYTIVGADNPDSQVGTGAVGMVFSEWAVMQDPAIWTLLRPILLENDGWAIFITTPRGRNHCYKMYQRGKDRKNWFVQILTIDETKCITEEQIQEERDDGMPEEMIQQEFYCSFDAALVNSFYGDVMTKAMKDGRIGNFPPDPKIPVETWWDLGMADQTSIWFMQRHYGQYRAVDYHFASGVGMSHYTQILQQKQEENGWTYREHLLPHDASVRELGTGMSRIETMRSLGVRNVRVIPRLSLQDGVNAVRNVIPMTFFHEPKCETGIEGLRQYSKKRLEGAEDPDGNAIFTNDPLHNWASHPADAFRTGCVGGRILRGDTPKILHPKIAIV